MCVCVYVCVCVCVRVSVCVCVCVCDGLLGQVALWNLRADFAMKWIDMKLYLQLHSIDGHRSGVKEGFVACKTPPGRPSSVRTPENIAQVFASVGRSARPPAVS